MSIVPNSGSVGIVGVVVGLIVTIIGSLVTWGTYWKKNAANQSIKTGETEDQLNHVENQQAVAAETPDEISSGLDDLANGSGDPKKPS
jgi:hypothetical protein